MSGVPAKAPSKVPMKARPGSPPAAGKKVSVKGSASPPVGAKSPVAGKKAPVAGKAPVGAKAPVASKTPVAGKAPVGKAPVAKAPVSAATSPSGKAPVAKVAAKAPVAGSPPKAAASPTGATSPAAKAPAKKMIAKKAPVAAATVLPPVPAVVPEPEPVMTSRAASIAPSQTYEPSDANPTASANASFAPSATGDDIDREPSIQSVVSGNGGGSAGAGSAVGGGGGGGPATVVIDSSIASGGMSASDAIAKNQQAAAALAALIGKQQEIDNEKIKALEEKNDILVKLLREREDELKGKIAEIEKEHSKLQHTYISSKRENEVLKEILSDRDGPKLVQKIEFMEDDAKRLREDLGKWKEMADYHRDAHLQALDHVQRLKEGQPIGPTETDWNDAQEKVARLARDNTNLTFKLASMEERVGTMENTGGNTSSLYNNNAAAASAASSPQRGGGAAEYNGMGAAGLNQSAASQSPFRNSHNGYLLRDQRGGPTNNAQFNSYSGSPVRGAPSMAGAGGVKGWRALLLPNGNVVYHNMITNRSQWEIPEELANNLVEQPTYQ